MIRYERLADHDRAGSRSGEPELDAYFASQVVLDEQRGAAVCHVAMDGTELVGFYTLSAVTIQLKGVSPQDQAGLPGYPSVPGILLGRMAVAASRQKSGIGGQLVMDAGWRVVELARKAGVAVLVVDAMRDDLVGYYQRFGFRRLSGTARRMYLPLATVRQWFEAAGPDSLSQ